MSWSYGRCRYGLKDRVERIAHRRLQRVNIDLIHKSCRDAHWEILSRMSNTSSPCCQDAVPDHMAPQMSILPDSCALDQKASAAPAQYHRPNHHDNDRNHTKGTAAGMTQDFDISYGLHHPGEKILLPDHNLDATWCRSRKSCASSRICSIF
jgi:hypothetical protein